MSEKHRRYFLKDKEAKAVLNQAAKKLKLDEAQFSKDRKNLEVVEAQTGSLFLVDSKPLLLKAGNDIFPALTDEKLLSSIPKAVVDMGAVPYVCKGADVMSPGIRRFDGEFLQGDIVLVVDEKHGKPIAVGEALHDSTEAKSMKHGPVLRNVHFVGDTLWNLMKQTTSKA
jgi:PUA domain protein